MADGEVKAAEIPAEVLDLLRWLAWCCMVQQKKRHEAIALPPEECREFVMMRWPIVQGIRNQMALEEIGRQPTNRDNFNTAIEWLLAHGTGLESYGSCERCGQGIVRPDGEGDKACENCGARA